MQVPPNIRRLACCAILLGCHHATATAPTVGPEDFAGSILNSDGTPASGALMGVTNLATGAQVAILEADASGHFHGAFPAGEYALAVTTDREYLWVEKQPAPRTAVELRLSRTCHLLAGRVENFREGSVVDL